MIHYEGSVKQETKGSIPGSFEGLVQPNHQPL